MSEKVYNKLVRDNIPNIIEATNKNCEIEIVEGEELEKLLNEKLQEEVNEYLESNDIEELADILEVVHGILNARDIGIDELEVVRVKKKEERGGFYKGIRLLKVY
ncbi:nucleoside triphosphate pyrophosphohydrolase [Alkaliphilus sp. MSJ-5]|uniref:Nucleoside triphosphate pyrophosphohydrolase n=1 Tax=Alkaliphilus flagellatus TaxID=2841507 RepID=A0ABS6G761_9FIRM|nr:nucleoside triphosphate pyrophosphohydrolase [Alkaliphilus flagellatus]MBU5677236.1 nucleoside triphosphate pyrophosphohydrolase [Alkaliphilus flagellatus]